MKFVFAVDEKQVKHLLYVSQNWLSLPHSTSDSVIAFLREFWGAAAKTAKEMSDNLISQEEF